MEKERRLARSDKSLLSHVMLSLAMGIVGGLLITEVLVTEDFLRSKELWPQIDALFSVERAYKKFVFPLLALLITAVYFFLFAPRSKKGADSQSADDSVGSGGRDVSVDEIKLGGSGSASVMQGQTVRTETVYAKYVVNCAGNYSDKVASMIGDNSFAITPRLGNYLLLHRNQVRPLNAPIRCTTTTDNLTHS